MKEEKKVASLRVDEVCLTIQVKSSSIEAFQRSKKAIDADPSIKPIFLCSGNPIGTLVSGISSGKT
jgi:hypothetical protein